ncbi:MAG: alanine--tRNA ligase-related protein [Thermoplasmata archaeon]|nr:alanyl-tRNA editing protein [Thermoplasmata archaeon]
MITEKLYWKDSYLKYFDAIVVSIEDNKIELDRTAFYPKGGGQVGDTGYINEIKVLDTIKENDTIFHVVEKNDFKIGENVSGKIDWDRRYKIMRNHSASHIVEYFMLLEFKDIRPYSSGLVDDLKDRTDYLTEKTLEIERIKIVENNVNAFIEENNPINIWIDENGIRHWESKFIKTKCAGTHVKNTSEIGKVKIEKGKKPGKGRERIETMVI